MRCNPEKGDLLITKVGTTGIPVIIDTDRQFSLFVSVALVKANWQLVDIRYWRLAILSPCVQEQIEFNRIKSIIEKHYILAGFVPQDTPIIELSEYLSFAEY